MSGSLDHNEKLHDLLGEELKTLANSRISKPESGFSSPSSKPEKTVVLVDSLTETLEEPESPS